MLDGSYNNNNRRHGGRCYDISLGLSPFPSRPAACASTNSFCNYHPNWWNSNKKPISDLKSTPGVFNWALPFACEFRQITDGLSNTLLMIERRPGTAVRAGMLRQEQLGVTTAIRLNLL